MREETPKAPLWTRDFTIITLGSAVSLLGSVLSSFAISIMVLELTGSTFLYALFNVAYQLPYLVVPLLAGPYLDRFSRKRAIYCLDFVSAAMYLAFFLLLRLGWFSYPVMLGGCMLNGVIGSIYSVAYESFYPDLIGEGNYAKAYSVSSLLSDLTGLAYPLGALLYDRIGSQPLFLGAAAGFFIAACFETQVRHQETHMASAQPVERGGALRRFRRDLRDGLAYMREERGLLIIAAYFAVISVVGGCESLYLPFFRSHSELYAAWPVAAATLYSIVSNFGSVGRLAGGVLHYRIRIPADKKFTVALAVYFIISLFEGAVLWLPIPLMALAFFCNGVLGVTSYNIRIAATQSYVPNEKRARFNGVFEMITSVGGVTGTLLIGALAEVLPIRLVLAMASVLSLLAAYVFIYRGRAQVARIYDREL